MKKNNLFKLKFTFVIVLAYFFVFPQFAISATKSYRFTNGTGLAAKDLHIKTSPAITGHDPATQQIPANKFPDHTDFGESSIGFGTGFGTGVANGASIVFTFEYDGTVPRVIEWWWTKSGDPNDDSRENRLGAENEGRRGQFDFVSTNPSTGDGLIEMGAALL